MSLLVMVPIFRGKRIILMGPRGLQIRLLFQNHFLGYDSLNNASVWLSGSEPGTPFVSRKDLAGLRRLKPPKLVESMMVERRAEKKRLTDEENARPIQAKTSEDLEAEEVVRRVQLF